MSFTAMSLRATGELGEVEKARVHRLSGRPLMALSHLRVGIERVTGSQPAQRWEGVVPSVVRLFGAASGTAPEPLRCLELSNLLREEGLCQLALGNRLLAVQCHILALESLMLALAADDTLIADLCPKVRELADHIMMF